MYLVPCQRIFFQNKYEYYMYREFAIRIEAESPKRAGCVWADLERIAWAAGIAITINFLHICLTK